RRQAPDDSVRRTHRTRMGPRSDCRTRRRAMAHSSGWGCSGKAAVPRQSRARLQHPSRRRAHRPNSGRPEIRNLDAAFPVGRPPRAAAGPPAGSRRFREATTMRSCLILLLLSAPATADCLVIPTGLDAYLPVPEHNPITREKVDLGKKLFSDTRLSRNNSMSCASCHDPNLAFTDGRPVSIGVGGRAGDRRVPRIINRGYGKSFFWDGRAATLEEQVLQPIQNPKELDLTLEEAVSRAGLRLETLQQALATYVRTILSGDSPYDQYLQGDSNALTTAQRLGLRLFRGKAGCAVCHLGPNLTDE